MAENDGDELAGRHGDAGKHREGKERRSEARDEIGLPELAGIGLKRGQQGIGGVTQRAGDEVVEDLIDPPREAVDAERRWTDQRADEDLVEAENVEHVIARGES